MKIGTFQSKGNMAKLFLPSNKCIYIPVQLLDSFVVQFSIENKHILLQRQDRSAKLRVTEK